jgi:hypothetical protein
MVDYKHTWRVLKDHREVYEMWRNVFIYNNSQFYPEIFYQLRVSPKNGALAADMVGRDVW